MSEGKNNRTKDFSQYDILDTAELEKILRADCDMSEDAESDPELLLYIMEVLANQRKENEPNEKTASEAWESFKENYYPEQKLAAAAEKKSRHTAAPWLRRVIATAAMLVLVVCIPITAYALDWEELWEIFAQWAKETFVFVSGEDTQITEPVKDNDEIFYSMQDMLKRSNRDPSIVPTWLPDGFVLQDIKKTITPVKETYYAIYINGENDISMNIHTYLEIAPNIIEISDDLIELYTKDGIEYYFFSNSSQLRIIWLNDAYECIISGDFTVEEGKQMIDSIGKG